MIFHSKPRRWGRALSCSVDAYRHVIQLQEDLESRALNLSAIEKLSANCPRCFGPNNEPKIDQEPDYIVCLDGNFQQRRHKDASVEISEIDIHYPNLFIHPSLVKHWEDINTKGQSDEAPVSPILIQKFSNLSSHH